MRNFRSSRWSRINQQRKETGKRSGLEVQIATQLDGLGVTYEYEKEKIRYSKPSEEKIYTPDYKLANGIIVEAKGEFTSGDRKKHLLVKAQHPDKDIRFVFSNPQQRISKQSKTTYADWCQKNGFQFAKGLVPKEWLTKARVMKCVMHDMQPNGSDIEYFHWKCSRCEHKEDSVRGHQ